MDFFTGVILSVNEDIKAIYNNTRDHANIDNRWKTDRQGKTKENKRD